MNFNQQHGNNKSQYYNHINYIIYIHNNYGKEIIFFNSPVFSCDIAAEEHSELFEEHSVFLEEHSIFSEEHSDTLVRTAYPKEPFPIIF